MIDALRGTYEKAAEASLVALAALGEEGAFAELMRRRQASIRGLMRRLCRSAALADDLAQQTFIQAWKSLRSLRAAGAFGGWLRQIAVNCWLQHARRNATEFQALEDAPIAAGQLETQTTTRIDLDRALAGLKANERLCVVLSYNEGLSHGEIAAATGWPLGTVKSHITRGVAELRTKLRPYGEKQ